MPPKIRPACVIKSWPVFWKELRIEVDKKTFDKKNIMIHHLSNMLFQSLFCVKKWMFFLEKFLFFLRQLTSKYSKNKISAKTRDGDIQIVAVKDSLKSSPTLDCFCNKKDKELVHIEENEEGLCQLFLPASTEGICRLSSIYPRVNKINQENQILGFSTYNLALTTLFHDLNLVKYRERINFFYHSLMIEFYICSCLFLEGREISRFKFNFDADFRHFHELFLENIKEPYLKTDMVDYLTQSYILYNNLPLHSYYPGSIDKGKKEMEGCFRLKHLYSGRGRTINEVLLLLDKVFNCIIDRESLNKFIEECENKDNARHSAMKYVILSCLFLYASIPFSLDWRDDKFVKDQIKLVLENKILRESVLALLPSCPSDQKGINSYWDRIIRSLEKGPLLNKTWDMARFGHFKNEIFV